MCQNNGDKKCRICRKISKKVLHMRCFGCYNNIGMDNFAQKYDVLLAQRYKFLAEFSIYTACSICATHSICTSCEKRDPSHTLRMTGNSLPLEGKVDCEARRMRWHFTNLFFTDTLCPTPHHRLRQSLSSPETATLLSLRNIFPIREIASRRSLSCAVILRECTTEESHRTN